MEKNSKNMELIHVEGERNPESVQQWISIVNERDNTAKGTQRSGISTKDTEDIKTKAKKHLSALGWVLAKFPKGGRRELRYKSPKGKWFYSLVTACNSCVKEEDESRQEQIVPDLDVSKKRVVDCDINDSTVGVSSKNCVVCHRTVCHSGGKLLLCGGCPLAFHHTCLGLSILPDEETWFCPSCCCDICGSIEASENNILMTCGQCQRRFHLECLKGEPCLESCRRWFCSEQCNRVFSALQNLIGCKIAVGDKDLVWTLMRAPNDAEHYDDEQFSKQRSAVEILKQGIEPTKDRFSGRDVVGEMIFWKDDTGVGRGFHTVIIERNNEPITVAAMRVDKDVAEIPLLATHLDCTETEMCRVLMDELEKQLSKIGVRRLVYPVAKYYVTTWNQRFGFSVMDSSERLKLVKHGMIDFVDTVMCHKFLRERQESSPTE